MIPPPPINTLHLGPVALHLYGLILGIGIVFAFKTLEWTYPRLGIDKAKIMNIAMPTVIAGLIGGRVYHVLSQPKFYWDNPAQSVMIWKGGLGIYGSIAFGAAAVIWAARRNKIKVGDLLDASAGAVVLAQGIGRWGNYVNQELFGKPTDLPWALQVDASHRPEQYLNNETFHPTFLYESIWNLSLGVALILLFRKWGARPAGTLTCIYLAMYSVARFFIEGIRIDAAHSWYGLRQNEWVAAIIFVSSVSVLAILMRKRRASTV